jgi:hypothetical protein
VAQALPRRVRPGRTFGLRAQPERLCHVCLAAAVRNLPFASKPYAGAYQDAKTPRLKSLCEKPQVWP